MAEMSVRVVSERVDDWVRRLEALYGTLDAWAAAVPGARVERGSLEQVTEPLMERFGVPPRPVPTWTMYKGTKRLSFVPSVIWIIGANGRVNITTNRRQRMLVDLGGTDGRPSDWQLAVDDARKLLVPLDRRVFDGLIAEAA